MTTLSYRRGGPSGFGYQKTPAGHQRVRFGAGRTVDAAHQEFGLSRGLAAFMPGVFDQGQTGSCTGHGTSTALYAACGAAGAPLLWVPSMRGLYAGARELGRVDLSRPLEDGGANPAMLMLAVAEKGVRPMGDRPSDGRFSDVDPQNVNQEDTLGEMIDEAGRRFFRDYEIASAQQQRVNDVCAALAAGLPVGAGFFVDTPFESWDSSKPPIGTPNFADPAGGGHWVCCYGFDTRLDGSKVFTVRNSWSDQWGTNGDFLASEDWLLNCFELIAFAAG